VSVSLASVVSLLCGATEQAFTPASLFSDGAKGAWYDPSDYTSLFQDSAGTTPVTAVEQPVGLMLDKSQGLVLGPEKVTNGDFSSGTTGWFLGTGWSIGSGVATANTTLGSEKLTSSANWAGQNNKTYLVTATVTMLATPNPSASVGINIGGTGQDVQVRTQNNLQAGVTYQIRAYATPTSVSPGAFLIRIESGQGLNYALNYTIDNISVKEIAGNHASQATTASRPVLRARYNFITYSQNQENAAWVKTPPTFGAITLSETPPSGFSGFSFSISVADDAGDVSQSITLVAGIYTVSFYSKNTDDGGAPGAVSVSLGAGSYNVPNDLTSTWVRRSFTFTATAGAATLSTIVSGLSAQGSFYGFQVERSSVATKYQSITTATSYDTAGFLPYLDLITDDSLSTGSIDFTATDKMSVCAGVTKLGDGAGGNYGAIAELSADLSANSGTFNLYGPATAPGGTPTFGFSSKGTLGVVASATGNAAPITRVLTGQGDIGGDQCILRINAVEAGTSTGNQGTGNFGNYPLFIGRRNNTQYPFNGRIYSLLVVGKTLSASELAATESYVATKTGVTL
jgi:hypothetical protein